MRKKVSSALDINTDTYPKRHNVSLWNDCQMPYMLLA